MLIDTVKKYPDNIALVYGNLRLTYKDLYTKSVGFSKGLNSIDVSQSNCIALILPNCPEFFISFYAVVHLHAIVLLLNPLFKEEEISYYINDSNARVIITDRKRAKVCQNIISKLDKKIDLVIVDGVVPLTKYFYDLILPQKPGDYDENPSFFTGNVLYQYSSGSTGKPKKVCRTQYNLYHEVKNFTETVNITLLDNILCVVPLHHAHGLGNCLLAATCNGATLVILEPVLRKGNSIEVPFVLRRSRVLELIETERVTIVPAVPYIFNILSETSPKIQANLSTVRLAFSAGNFLSKEIFEKFLNRFEIPVRQLYGCTEAGAISINLDKQLQKTFDSVGTPLKNVEIKIVDDEDNLLPVGSSGEIVIKSKTLTNGYCDMLELNQQVFKDNWFLTGDLGKKDEVGRLYITGRKKLLIDSGGQKVDPLEIEKILMTHPLIQESVVVGVKQDNAGEIIKAVIVIKEGEKISEKEILFFVKEKVADFKIPQIIEFRNVIPKSPLGKILRKDLV